MKTLIAVLLVSLGVLCSPAIAQPDDDDLQDGADGRDGRSGVSVSGGDGAPGPPGRSGQIITPAPPPTAKPRSATSAESDALTPSPQPTTRQDTRIDVSTQDDARPAGRRSTGLVALAGIGLVTAFALGLWASRRGALSS